MTALPEPGGPPLRGAGVAGRGLGMEQSAVLKAVCVLGAARTLGRGAILSLTARALGPQFRRVRCEWIRIFSMPGPSGGRWTRHARGRAGEVCQCAGSVRSAPGMTRPLSGLPRRQTGKPNCFFSLQGKFRQGTPAELRQRGQPLMLRLRPGCDALSPLCVPTPAREGHRNCGCRGADVCRVS